MRLPGCAGGAFSLPIDVQLFGRKTLSGEKQKRKFGASKSGKRV
jgi:hypothetical protein